MRMFNKIPIALFLNFGKFDLSVLYIYYNIGMLILSLTV